MKTVTDVRPVPGRISELRENCSTAFSAHCCSRAESPYIPPAHFTSSTTMDPLNALLVEPEERENSLAICTIRDLNELEALRASWNSWPGTQESDIDFFSSMVRSRGNRCRPHVIVLARKLRPVAILIGLCECRKMPFKLDY